MMPRLPAASRRPGEGACQPAVAFTLIELLAVVSIIMLLLALLFPMFSRARDQAQMAGCAANLAQLSAAINSWTADHNGNFTSLDVTRWEMVDNGVYRGMNGYGHASQAWYHLMGGFGYIGEPVKIRHPHLSPAYGAGVVDIWRYPLLRCPGEPEWTTMRPDHTDPNGLRYYGVPYNNWTHEFIGNSYHINAAIRAITFCTCNRNWTAGGSLCGSDACDDWYGRPPRNGYPDHDSCCAIGYHTLKDGTPSARAVILMDMYNSGYPAWHWEGFYPTYVGYTDNSESSVYHMTDPGALHAFRHPGQRANMMFHDGHVEALRPMEYVEPSRRVRVINIWARIGGN